MTNLQAGKKESRLGQPQTQESTSSTGCQEKTLVSIDTIREKFVVNVYAHCIEFIPRTVNKSKFEGNRGTRSSIKEFSRRSRFRLFKILAMMDSKPSEKPLFVSLTYHYGHLNNPKSTKSQLHIFLTRLRQFDPGVQFIWRIEFQIRGAPHYHLIIFPGHPIRRRNKHIYSIEVSRIWHSIADPRSKKHSEYGCKVVTIRSYREACIYLSKYVAKCHNTEVNLVEGKHWGSSKNLPFKIQKVVEYKIVEAREIIEKIRQWLLRKGKYEQADSHYLNLLREATVFMEPVDFDELNAYELPPWLTLPDKK